MALPKGSAHLGWLLLEKAGIGTGERQEKDKEEEARLGSTSVYSEYSVVPRPLFAVFAA